MPAAADDDPAEERAAAEERALVETPEPSTPTQILRVSSWSVTTKHRIGSLLVLVVVCLYVGSGVMIQVLFDEMEFEKPFFFSFVSVGLCSTYLLSPLYHSCRRHLLTQSKHRTYTKVQQQPSPHAAVIGSPLHLLRPAMLLAPSYFCLNYTYFFSLDLTSVSSTMILSASTGVWTLLFSRILLGERLTRLKLLTVFVSLLGMSLVVLSSHLSPSPAASAAGSAAGSAAAAAAAAAASATATSATAHGSSRSVASAANAAAAAAATSAEDEPDNGLTGDLLALMSAAASGVYMVLLPVCVPDAETVHMPSLFGMMGVVCTLALLPLFPLLHWGAVETFQLPPSRSATISLLVNAATSTVLPDMLLAQAIMMTSPLVATLGLSLMIPLSVFADYVRGLANLTPQFFVGTLCVFVGFLLEIKAEEKPGARGLDAKEGGEGEQEQILASSSADGGAEEQPLAMRTPQPD